MRRPDVRAAAASHTVLRHVPPRQRAVTGAAEAPPSASRPEVGRGPGQLEADVAHSVRNAATLGASLLSTWAVALVVRVLLPRHLGPAAFGNFQFADSFTTTIFIVMTLGLEVYVRREIGTRPEHASDFIGGTLLIRLALSAVAMAVGVAALAAAGKPADVLSLVALLGVAQVLFNINTTSGALLHAIGSVRGFSVLSVASKVVWGLGIVVALAFGGGIVSVGAAMLVAEALRTIGMEALTRRHLRLRYRIDLAASTAVILASLPFFILQLATTAYAKIDVSIMSFLTNDVEVGWYGAAQNIAGLSMLLSPLVGWVLLPLSSRAAARSDEELTQVSRRAMELILTIAFPVTLLLAVGADVIVRTAFGRAFEPAAGSLRLLAPTFVLTYVTMVSGTILIRLGRGWPLAWLSVSAMVISPLLNLWLIPWGLATFGPGGAGHGAAIALIITEFYAAAAMTWLLGPRAFDRRSVVMAVKTILACLVVIVIDRLLLPLGAWRLAIDGAVYVVLVVSGGAVSLREWAGVARSALRRRRRAGEATP